MSRSLELSILFALTLLALALRLVCLDWESIWLDEAFSLEMAKASYAGLMTGQPLDPGNPPIYYVMLKAWCEVFGPSVESARAFSGVSGALAVPATWLLARVCGGTLFVRLVAAGLVAISPPLVFLGREVRVYALFATVVTFAAAAAEAMVRNATSSSITRRLAPWAAWTLLAASLSYLHYYGLFLLVVFGVYLFAWIALSSFGLRASHSAAAQALPPSNPIRGLASLTLSFVLIAAAFIPWLPTFREQIALGTARGESTWILHLAVLPLYSLAGHTLAWKEEGVRVLAALNAAAVFVYGIALLGLFRRRPPMMPIVVSAGLLAMVVAIAIVKSPMIQSRYLVVIFPSLMILMAWGWDAGKGRWPRLVFASGTIAGVLMLASLAMLFGKHHKEDWRPVAEHIKSMGPDLRVFCYEDMARLSLAYYAPELDIVSIPSADAFGEVGDAWEIQGWRSAMSQEADGFWFVLYVSLAGTQQELPRIDSWLRQNFEVSHEWGGSLQVPRFPLIRVYRLQRQADTPAADR